jgi:hypothetical protein
LQEAGQNLIEASTPIPGLGVGAPPVVVTSFNVGAIISASIIFIFKLAYYVLLTLALIKLATELFNVLFPAKKYLKATYFVEIMRKGCAYFGYDFQSTLLNESPYFALMPVPLTPERESIFDTQIFSTLTTLNFSTGLPSSSDTVATFGQFIDSLETMFNARLIVRDGVVRIERRDWLENQAINMIEPALNLSNTTHLIFGKDTTFIMHLIIPTFTHWIILHMTNTMRSFQPNRIFRLSMKIW